MAVSSVFLHLLPHDGGKNRRHILTTFQLRAPVESLKTWKSEIGDRSSTQKSSILHRPFVTHRQEKKKKSCKHWQTTFINWSHAVFFLVQQLLNVWNAYRDDKLLDAMPIHITYAPPVSCMYLLLHTPEQLSKHVLVLRLLKMSQSFISTHKRHWDRN